MHRLGCTAPEVVARRADEAPVLFCTPRIFRALGKRPHRRRKVSINGCTFIGRQLMYGKAPISPVYLSSVLLPRDQVITDNGRVVR